MSVVFPVWMMSSASPGPLKNMLKYCVMYSKLYSAHGMKLRLEKCELFIKEVRYVGLLVSADGVRVDPKDIEAMHALKEKSPQTVGDVR